jgi:hypothetical protein
MQMESIARGEFRTPPGKANLFLDIPEKRLLRIFRIGRKKIRKTLGMRLSPKIKEGKT